MIVPFWRLSNGHIAHRAGSRRSKPSVTVLTTTGGERLADARTGKNRQHLLVGLLRQSVFGRLAALRGRE